jgi:cellulose synthase/poly-beta-1,6-N-acetylglucosamine synthase-like glycosyltransferase
MMYTIFHILFIIVFIYAALDVLYLFTAALAGHLKKKPAYIVIPDKKRIAVLITSYKEDEVIIHTAQKASSHNYPPEYFEIFLAADHLQPATIQALNTLNIHVTPVYFETGSKAKSLNNLLNHIPEDKFDIALVLDGDNIMQDGFLEKINAAFHNSFNAVQGHRTAKNKNTAVAILDAISEEINNHLFRKAQRAMGLSSSTIGSGMAFEFKKLREVYNKPGILDNPACDREVDFEMMKAGIVVEYVDDAYVLDEKVSKRQVYQNQRRRWLESQIIHLKLFFSPKEHVKNKTKDYWNKLFINLILPRIIFIALFTFIFCLYLFQHFFNLDILFIPFLGWIILFIFYALSMLLSIPRKLYTVDTLRALIHLPGLLISFLKAALTMNYRRKEFVHTPKSFTDKQDKS